MQSELLYFGYCFYYSYLNNKINNLRFFALWKKQRVRFSDDACKSLMSDFPRELELGLIRGGIQVTELPSMQGIPEEHDRALLKQAATLAARSDLTETFQVFPNAPPLAASPTAALLVQEDPVSGESQHLHAPNCSGSSGPAGQAFFALIAGQMVSSLLLWVLDCFGKRRVHESASLPQLVWCRR